MEDDSSGGYPLGYYGKQRCFMVWVCMWGVWGCVRVCVREISSLERERE